MSENQNTVTPGIYENKIGVFRVVKSQGSSRLYAKRLVGTQWVYAAGAIKNIRPETRLSLEAAKAYGRKTGRCIICQAELTDPKSVEAGIGPVCAKRV